MDRSSVLCVCCQPEGSGDELTRLAEEAGFAAFNLPLVALRAIESGMSELKSFLDTRSGKKLGVIFSSKMAARTAAALLVEQDCEIYAVGEKTAGVLRTAGLEVAIVGESDLSSLHKQIIQQRSEQFELLHICGELSAEFSSSQRIVVYRTEDVLPEQSRVEKLDELHAKYSRVYWLFTNARSAERLKELIDSDLLVPPRGKAVAIGASTMGGVKELTFKDYIMADQPDLKSMIAAVRGDASTA